MERGVPDWLEREAERLAAVRKRLTEIHPGRTVGYLCDSGSSTRFAMSGTEINEYYLSQHVLAPFVLDLRARDCDWTVANLRAQHNEDTLLAGFVIVENFGDGVLLLRRAAP